MADKKQIRKLIINLIIILVIIAATVFAVIKINASKQKGLAGGGAFGGPGKGSWGGGGNSIVTSVQTVIAAPQTMHDFVNTNGNIETQTAIEVYPSISGKVVQVNASLGSPVKRGDVIAYVDPSTAGAIYQRSPVIAPISGSIIQTPVKTGQQVSTGTVVTKIGDIDNLQVSASIPERYVGDLKIGLKAEITLEAYPGQVFTAKVVKISPVLDAASRTKQVILNFDKKDARVNAGMFAKVRLYTVDYVDVISIIQDAIVTVGDSSYLYVVKDDSTVEKRLITTGKNVSGYYQITSGINPYERVVVAGMLTLTDGATVKDISQKDDSENAAAQPDQENPNK